MQIFDIFLLLYSVFVALVMTYIAYKGDKKK